MNLTDVRDGLAVAANAISELRVSAYPIDAASTPIFIVGDIEVLFDKAMGRGLDELIVTCWLYVSRATDRGGHMKVSGYLKGSGTGSIKAALEVDRTLGGACSTMRLQSAKTGGLVDIAGNPYFGAELTVYVAGSGT